MLTFCLEDWEAGPLHAPPPYLRERYGTLGAVGRIAYIMRAIKLILNQ